MSTIVVSDRFWIPRGMNIEICPWRPGRPSVEGYDVVLLDLLFSYPGNHGYAELARESVHFYELGTEVERSLKAGGVVIALMGPITITSRNLSADYAKELVSIKNNGIFGYDKKFLGNRETTYDWLDQGFLVETKIDALFTKRSEGVKTLWGISEFNRYVNNWANGYWITIEGIDVGKGNASMIHRVAQRDRWKVSGVERYPAKILAVGKHTKLPVAAAFKYMNWDGVLVLLNPCGMPVGESAGSRNDEEMGGLLQSLEGIAKK